jgi:hypothetical protein
VNRSVALVLALIVSAILAYASKDPHTKKIGIRHVKATNAAGTQTKIQVRDFAPVYTDEPASLGGTNSAPSPLETVLVALVGGDGVIINGVATAMGFSYSGVDFACESQIDVRGPKGCRVCGPFSRAARSRSRSTVTRARTASGNSARMSRFVARS